MIVLIYFRYKNHTFILDFLKNVAENSVHAKELLISKICTELHQDYVDEDVFKDVTDDNRV